MQNSIVTDSTGNLIDVSDLVHLQDQHSQPQLQQTRSALDSIIDDILNIDSNNQNQGQPQGQLPDQNPNATPAAPTQNASLRPASSHLAPAPNPNLTPLSSGNMATLVNPSKTAVDDLKELAIQPFKPPPGAVKALSNADFEIYFEVQKNAANPNQVAIRTTIANLGLHPLTNFRIQYGVPVGWVLRAQPLNSSILPARGAGPLMQVLYLENTGNLPLMMKTHATFMFGSQPMTADDVVNNAVFA